jgi:hypothetical protein
MADVEIFTPTGVLEGVTARIPLTNNGPDLTAPLAMQDARWYPIDGRPPERRGEIRIPPDDILVIDFDEHPLAMHMTWFSVTLEVGPYRVAGEIGTHPGFDPVRALARPGGTFVALRDATVELLGEAGSGVATRPFVHVNRYAVESVKSMLMLGHYFPGARLIVPEVVLA